MVRSKLTLARVDLLLVAVANALIFGSLLIANVLPKLYFAALAAVLVLVDIIVFFLLGRGKKEIGSTRGVLGLLVAIAMLIGGVACAFVMSQFMDAMGAIAGAEGVDYHTTKVYSFNVYVLEDSPAHSLSDLAGDTFGLSAEEGDEVNAKCLAHLQDKLGKDIASTQEKDIFALVDSLYSGKTKAIVLNMFYDDILNEGNRFPGFLSKVRPVYSFSVQVPIKVGGQPAIQPEKDRGEFPEYPFVVYISGSDTRKEVLSTSRSDVNILAVVNPITKQVLLVNTPRDYYIPNPAGDGALDKLTHCGLYGTACSMEALGNLYQVPVDYYAQINFQGFETMIDAVGGVDVHSDVSFGKFVAGMNHLNGQQALSFVRERHALSGGDNDRGKNQMKVIKALIEKLSVGTFVNSYSDIIASLKNTFSTSLTKDEISALVKMQVADMAAWDVRSFAVTGSNGSATTYSSPNFRAYVMHPNQNSVAYASSLMSRIMDGEVLTAEDMKMPG